VEKLAKETPAKLIVFDLLVDKRGKSIVNAPLAERRKKLEALAKKNFPKNKSIELSPQTRDLATAKGWLRGAGGDVDGVIAKQLDLPYPSGHGEGEATAHSRLRRGRFQIRVGRKTCGLALAGPL
jgi:ATP-dependent DNA ligase